MEQELMRYMKWLAVVGSWCLTMGAASAVAQVSDAELLEFVQQRQQAVRITTDRRRMREDVQALCRPSPDKLADGEENAHPGLAAFHIFVTPQAEEAMWDPYQKFPEGALIVKEKTAAEKPDQPLLFTGMLKREAGFWPEGGDWEYFAVDGGAQRITARGKLANCQACHQKYRAQDDVTRVYSAGFVPHATNSEWCSDTGAWRADDQVLRFGTGQTLRLPASRAKVFGRLRSQEEALRAWRLEADADGDGNSEGGTTPPEDLVRWGGPALRYEPQPHKNTLGYWTQIDDYAAWEFETPRGGDYQLAVLQGCGAGSGGALVTVSVADQSLEMEVQDTGHFQNFIWRDLGVVQLPAGKPLRLEVRAKNRPGGAVMDLRQVRLTPVSR